MFDFMMDDNEDFSYQSSGPNVPDAMDCMRCGMCLSQCPTFALTQDEQEGPRQRIRTLSKLVIENEDVDSEAIEHLQNCTQCRACEAICPSKMDYSQLFDQAQQQLFEQKTQTFKAKIALALIKNKRAFNASLPLSKIYINSHLQKLSRKSGIVELLGLKRVDKLATVKPELSALKANYPVAEPKGTVALFAGCISDRFDRTTLTSVIEVLNAIGYEVVIPEQQGCCGAIHYHSGEQNTAKQLMNNNIDVFNQLNVEALLYCATGCGSQLNDYQQILKDDDNETSSFTAPLVEISEFIEQHWPESLQLIASEQRVVVHEPCSQRNVLKNQQSVYSLLSKIPNLKISELADNHLCCGAGGDYMLTHTDNADALCEMKWQHIEQTGADYLVSSNIGCAMHLKTGNKDKNSIEILHPISLIAKQLRQ